MTRTKGFGHLGGPVKVKVQVKSARTGRTLRDIEDFPENLKEKKWKKKNPKYAYLCSLDPQGSLRITMNIVTGKLSFGMRPTPFYFTETLTPEQWTKIDAARSLEACSRVSRTGYLAKKSYSNSERLTQAFEFYRNQFLDKIKAQRKAYRVHLAALKRRGRGRK
jgi:hypothetical protein